MIGKTSIVSYTSNGKEKVDEILLDKLSSLDAQAMEYSWDLASWRSYVSKQKFLIIMTFNNGELLGFLVGRHSYDLDYFELDKIVVKKEKRSLGLGRGLFNLLQETLVSVGKGFCFDSISIHLEVAPSNTVALKFYNKLGFLLINRVKSYYSDGQDALKMQKSIIS